MLTLFENYGNVQCGAHFKEPRLPVWVVCSESHYSVLFGPKRALAVGGGDKARAPLFAATRARVTARARSRLISTTGMGSRASRR